MNSENQLLFYRKLLSRVVAAGACLPSILTICFFKLQGILPHGKMNMARDSGSSSLYQLSRNTSGRRSAAFEDEPPRNTNGPTRSPEKIMIAVDASRELSGMALDWAMGKIVQPGDHITFLGILHRIINPMGYKTQADAFAFIGTSRKALEQEIYKQMNLFEEKLRRFSEFCDRKGVYLDITITAGTPLRLVLLQEASTLQATCVILDRHLKRDKKFYTERLSCNLILMIQENQVEVLRDTHGPCHTACGSLRSSTDSSFSRYTSSSDTIPRSEHSSLAAEIHASTESQTSETKKIESSFLLNTQQEMIPKGLADVSPDHSASKSSQEISLLSGSLPGSDFCPSMDFSSSSAHSREDSFIELHVLDSPEGVMTIWSSTGINQDATSPASSHSSCNEEDELETVLTTTKMLSSPLATTSSVIAPSMLQTATDSVLRPVSGSSGSLSEVTPISVQPWRPVPSQLNELLTSEDFQDIQENDIHEKQWTRGEISQPNMVADLGPSLESKETQSPDKREKDMSNMTVPENSVQACHKESLQEQKAYELDHHKKLSPHKLNSAVEGKDNLLRKSLAKPPPLCSVCKLKSPELGQSPKIFSYDELKTATGDFSPENLIAEGGFGCIYKGVLKDDHVIAVKKLKSSSLQGDVQFSAEVEALSCAQHRNLVRLIGYCMEFDQRALVYEYVCNGSLDQHLSGRSSRILEWSSRYKIAVGAARGLRYLHDECRVGCIVHRDMRPNNILLTHDFTAMVGDFGLAKLNSNGDVAIETQVIGSLGYVAPEYVECGQVTSKTDVYSFGVVLLELITGRKAVDLWRPKGQLSLTEWARPKLYPTFVKHELLDPKLEDSYDLDELNCMAKAASQCIRRDPSSRPFMSQILRILEGEVEDMRNRSQPVSTSVKPVGEIEEVLEDERYHQQMYKMQPPHHSLNQTSSRKVPAGARNWRWSKNN